MNRRVAVRGIFVKDGKILAVKHKPYEHIKVTYWNTVGGGVDPGEPLEIAVEREIIEETGIKPRVGRLLFVQQFLSTHEPPVEQMEFFFLIENPEDYESIDLSKATHGDEEIEKIEFIDPSKEEYGLLPTFLRDIDCDNLPENTQFYNYI